MKLPECEQNNEVDTEYRVLLSCAHNPDIRSGYWGTPPEGGAYFTCIDTIDAARDECAAYIIRNELGSGNWTGGLVQRWNGRAWIEYCQISYNGRAWLPNGEEVNR
jgi:hypothetical protein